MTSIFKVAAVQMNCIEGEKKQNLHIAEKMIREAAAQGAVLIAVPELFDTGYRVEEKDQILADTIPGSTTDHLVAICRELHVYVIGTLIEKSGGELYDTAFLVGPQGIVGIYRKNTLWDKEKGRFQKGDDVYPVFDIGFCKVGIQICYEIGFPEGARILSLCGADIIAYPSAFGLPRLYAWELASRARALENGNYVIACNRSGTEKEETIFAASSRIVNPRGDVIVAATKENEVIIAEIDLEQIQRQRKTIPYLEDLNRNVVASYYQE